eukprot:scaffold50386_cov16-Tisochrysis_lutea.AAC.1
MWTINSFAAVHVSNVDDQFLYAAAFNRGSASPYVKPGSVYYTFDGRTKRWDIVESHPSKAAHAPAVLVVHTISLHSPHAFIEPFSITCVSQHTLLVWWLTAGAVCAEQPSLGHMKGIFQWELLQQLEWSLHEGQGLIGPAGGHVSDQKTWCMGQLCSEQGCRSRISELQECGSRVWVWVWVVRWVHAQKHFDGRNITLDYV